MRHTIFQTKVLNSCREIPRGMVTTYLEIAKNIGNEKAIRAVGNALNKNKESPMIPCHRVVRSNGEVGGFAHGTKKKIGLLKKEGIKIKNNKIIYFLDKLFRF